MNSLIAFFEFLSTVLKTIVCTTTDYCLQGKGGGGGSKIGGKPAKIKYKSRKVHVK
jgi:hypothetical protein